MPRAKSAAPRPLRQLWWHRENARRRRTSGSAQRRRRILKRRISSLEAQAAGLGLAQVMTRGFPGEIRYWSRGMERLYGFSAAEAVGRISHELLRTEFPQLARRPRSRVAGTRGMDRRAAPPAARWTGGGCRQPPVTASRPRRRGGAGDRGQQRHHRGTAWPRSEPVSRVHRGFVRGRYRRQDTGGHGHRVEPVPPRQCSATGPAR